MSAVSFIKMHGLGNDFVIIDARTRPVAFSAAQARAIADRKTGIGCDQFIVMEAPRNGHDVPFMRMRNADGSDCEACGNGARCVADFLMREAGSTQVTFETMAGLVTASAVPQGRVAVDMGPVWTEWQEIPLARAMDTLHVDVALGPLRDPVAVSIGNPHIVFFVPDAEAIDIATLGPQLEHHPLFPARANIEVATVQSRNRVRMRVWERGVGITRACGTGACCTLVAAVRRGLADRKAEVVLDGGPLDIEWLANGHVLMTGPVARSFSGTVDPSLLA